MSVAVVCDSTSYVPIEQLDALGVRRVSLYVGWDGDLKPERDYTDLDAFYARLRESDSLPQTSQPSVGDFLAVYEPLIARGDDIVSIHLAEGLSGTCQSAREAAKALDGGRVEVVDAETGAGGLGLMVLAAAQAARDGARRRRRRGRRARGPRARWRCGSAWTRSSSCARAGASARRRRCWARRCRSSRSSRSAPRSPRSGACGRASGPSSGWSPTCTSCATRARRSGSSSTRSRAVDAQRLVEQGTEILGAPPVFCTQVGPVLGAHLGSGLLVGGLVTR